MAAQRLASAVDASDGGRSRCQGIASGPQLTSAAVASKPARRRVRAPAAPEPVEEVKSPTKAKILAKEAEREATKPSRRFGLRKPGVGARPAGRPGARAGTKGARKGGRAETRRASGRYTPPVRNPYNQPSPMYVPIIMFTLLGGGMLVILLNYLLLTSPRNGLLMVGLGLILAGIMVATRLR